MSDPAEDPKRLRILLNHARKQASYWHARYQSFDDLEGFVSELLELEQLDKHWRELATELIERIEEREKVMTRCGLGPDHDGECRS